LNSMLKGWYGRKFDVKGGGHDVMEGGVMVPW